MDTILVGVLQMTTRIRQGRRGDMYPFVSKQCQDILVRCEKSRKFDLYVTIKKVDGIWTLVEVIGSVDNNESYTMYLLRLYNLRSYDMPSLPPISYHLSMPLQSDIIYTIDPDGTYIYDDAVSIRDNCIIVYIANVIPFLDEYDMWQKIDNLATIYLPDKAIRMLPNSEEVSLKEGEYRDVLQFSIEDGVCKYIGPTQITVTKNHTYDSIIHETEFTTTLCTLLGETKSPSDIVRDLMTTVNKSLSVPCIAHNLKKSEICNTISSPVPFANYSISGDKYIISDTGEYYATVTSPIRRVIDLVNSISLLGENASSAAKAFMHQQISNIEYINQTMKYICRVQKKTLLYALCEDNAIYKAFAFKDKLLYVPALSTIVKVKSDIELNTWYSIIALQFIKKYDNKFRFDVLCKIPDDTV